MDRVISQRLTKRYFHWLGPIGPRRWVFRETTLGKSGFPFSHQLFVPASELADRAISLDQPVVMGKAAVLGATSAPKIGPIDIIGNDGHVFRQAC